MASIDRNDTQADIRALAEEIAAYLRERGQVADTLEGIARWWILRQRLHEGQRKVEQAMDYLCAQGLVSIRQLPDGAVLYTSNAENPEQRGSEHGNEPDDGQGPADDGGN